MAQREDDAEPAALQPAATAGQFRFRGMTVRFVRAGNRRIRRARRGCRPRP